VVTAVVVQVGLGVSTLVPSPFTNPLAVQVSAGLAVLKVFVALFAVIVSGVGFTVSVPLLDVTL